MDLHFDRGQLWRQQIERRLYELGSLVKGQVQVQADRLADTLELIGELEGKVSEAQARIEELSKRIDKIGQYVKYHLPPKEEKQ